MKLTSPALLLGLLHLVTLPTLRSAFALLPQSSLSKKTIKSATSSEQSARLLLRPLNAVPPERNGAALNVVEEVERGGGEDVSVSPFDSFLPRYVNERATSIMIIYRHSIANSIAKYKY